MSSVFVKLTAFNPSTKIVPEIIVNMTHVVGMTEDEDGLGGVWTEVRAVSYTHLTLPTIYSV